MAYLEYSNLVPVNLVDQNRSLIANYHWKHLDEWLSFEQFMEMENAPCKPQKWQNDDIIFLQFMADFSPIFIKVRNLKTKKVVLSHQMDIVAAINGVSYFQDQVAFDNLTLFPEGYYQLEIYAGDPVQVPLTSEILWVKQDHPGTILIKYSNNFNNSILWETGIYFTIRVDAVMPLIDTGSLRTTYIDQIYNSKTPKGIAYGIYDLSVGTQGGEPKYIFTKLEDILNQNNKEFDGLLCNANVGAKFKYKQPDRYPYWQGDIELMGELNRGGKRFDGTGILLQKWTTTYAIEGELFGPIDGSANDNSYLIQDTI